MRRWIAVLLSGILLFSLAACGGGDTGAAPENAGTEQTEQTPETPETPAPEPPAPETLPPEEPVGSAPVLRPLQVWKGSTCVEEWDDDFNQLISAAWEEFAPIDGYPRLSAALEELNTEQSVGAYSFWHEWLPYAKEHLAAEPEYFGGYTSESAYVIQRADSLVFSIREDFGSYTGGVHGNYGAMGWNFDSATGARLELADVLTDTDSLDRILAEKLREKYDMTPLDSLDLMLADYAPENYTWTLDYQGITFYFSPYEIAPYAAGLLTVTVWFDEMPELFAQEYTAAPSAGWAKMLSVHSEIEVDLGSGDGERGTLFVTTGKEENGSLKMYVILNGGSEQYLEECYGFTMKPLLVCLGEAGSERYFLYVEAAAENDYTTMYVYELIGDEIVFNSELSGAGFAGVWTDTAGEHGIWYESVLNDPSQFVLGSIVQTLGTWTGYKPYTADARSGAIVPLQEYYELNSAHPIISAVDLEVTMLPSREQETLPAGTNFYLLRTDGAAYAELALDDGRECRIEIEEIDWTHTINGVPEWECFENLMYAG